MDLQTGLCIGRKRQLAMLLGGQRRGQFCGGERNGHRGLVADPRTYELQRERFPGLQIGTLPVRGCHLDRGGAHLHLYPIVAVDRIKLALIGPVDGDQGIGQAACDFGGLRAACRYLNLRTLSRVVGSIQGQGLVVAVGGRDSIGPCRYPDRSVGKGIVIDRIARRIADRQVEEPFDLLFQLSRGCLGHFTRCLLQQGDGEVALTHVGQPLLLAADEEPSQQAEQTIFPTYLIHKSIHIHPTIIYCPYHR